MYTLPTKNGDVIVDQSTKPNPTTLYGKSKLAAEGQLAELQDKGFSVAILRAPPRIWSLLLQA